MLQYWRVFALTMAILAIGAFQLYGVFSNQGYQPQQPIPFSHVLHAGVMKMECLYCHSSAEKSAHAGIPSTDLCMGCHSIVKTDSPHIQKLTKYYESGEPVPWVRIHRLPDHSYFSHRWHVAAGIACQTCHGPVEEMPVVKQWSKLEMGACMTCHKQDTYAKNVVISPTAHELPATEEELNLVHAVEAHGAPEGEAWASAREKVERVNGTGISAEEATLLAARYKEYKENKYLHGRPYQLRGKNASMECSTCHY